MPNEILDLGAGDSAPPWFLEAPAWLPVELDDVEALGKLPAICVGVVHAPVWVVLDDDRGNIRLLQKLPCESCQHLDSIRDRRSQILFQFGENGYGRSGFFGLPALYLGLVKP